MNLNEFFFVSLGPIEFEECNAAIATEGNIYHLRKDLPKEKRKQVHNKWYLNEVS